MPTLTLTYCTDAMRCRAARGGGGRRFLYLYILCAVLTLTACGGGGKADGWQELREEANRLYNDRQFDEALAIYERAFDGADAEGRLKLRQDIIDCYLAMGEEAKARSLLDDLVKAARASGNTYAEAEGQDHGGSGERHDGCGFSRGART